MMQHGSNNQSEKVPEAKCEVFWPTGDSTFPKIPATVHRVGVISRGAELLGCPLWG